MQVVYDYRYVIACSSLPGEFKREFRKLVRGKVNWKYDRRTGANYAVSPETQCRRVAELMDGFEALRAGGFALQTPWNFQGKHLSYLIARWSAQDATWYDQAKLVHWREFLLWIRKRTLLALLNSTVRAQAPYGDKSPAVAAVVPARGGPAIPVLTYDNVLSALTEHRGNLRKAARALGTTTRALSQAFTEDTPSEKQLSSGIRILT
jgi:Transcriptional regulator containing GAF, AAA-type ATPase, and DNA binding domains